LIRQSHFIGAVKHYEREQKSTRQHRRRQRVDAARASAIDSNSITGMLRTTLKAHPGGDSA
jgi:hypothetical protein